MAAAMYGPDSEHTGSTVQALAKITARQKSNLPVAKVVERESAAFNAYKMHTQ
jgi:hypothetical protein